MQATQDVIIVGGGIIGLATAWKMHQLKPGLRLILLEKEEQLASHQTGRNSGVIHSGIYYKPGSTKSRTCREGKRQLEAFCQEHEIAWERCGKVIVALDKAEEGRLHSILHRGQANGVECRLISGEELKDREPHARGISAIHVSETGIVDYLGVCRRLAELITADGGNVITGAKIETIHATEDLVTVDANKGCWDARILINCAGLYSDRVALQCGHPPGIRIVPFRGEYFELKADAPRLCRHLIYPVPDPRFPFLGVHLTRMVQGGIECGPNAVFAFAREGYRFLDINGQELWWSLAYPGFWRLIGRHWRSGLSEMRRSLSKSTFVKALQRLTPEIRPEHLTPCDAGVRAQAVRADGSLVDDFFFLKTGPCLHVLNAPSPAATASLSIADEVVARVVDRL